MPLPIANIKTARPFPPRISMFTARFWDGLAEGQFLTTKCAHCEKLTFPPKPICPYCWSSKVVWQSLLGRGRLYSRTTIHAAPKAFAAEVPYQVAIVDLEENLRIVTQISGDVALDAPVSLTVLKYDDGCLFEARALTDD